MALRQSLLNFYKSRPARKETAVMATPDRNRPSILRADSSTSSDTDPDTIVVSNLPPRQLPTPSESSLDVSILDAQVVSMKEVSKGRARRVSRRLTKSESHDLLIETADDETLKTRTVSGETLVNMDNASQSTLVKEGIAALDLPWDMSEAFSKGGKHDLLAVTSSRRTSTAGDAEDDESEMDQQERVARAAAKKAKMKENNQLWEARRKSAQKQATRRSSRMPLLEKASEMVSNIATSVLGKRKDRTTQSTSNPNSQSTKQAGEPEPKKQRLSKAPTPPEEPIISAKAPSPRREKKWLNSGLFAGQQRTVSSQKSRKSGEAVQPPTKNWVLPLPMYAGERLLTQGRDFKLPFDIFSPLPAGQPKPDEWKKVNKNVFVGDAAQAWRKSKYEETSLCLCTPETGCDQNCMNRYMYYECDSRNCGLTEEQCGNRNFELLKQRVKRGGKYNVGVEVIKTGDRGYGVRSNRTFEPNQIIVEYTGEIITQEECEHRMRSMYKNNEVRRRLCSRRTRLTSTQSYYLMLFDQNMIIDATRGSIARFVNHSCDPNCRMEKWTVNGKPRMALFAGNRGIMTGDELTYDYNFDPYSQKNVQACRCGADNCRGFLGPRPKEERKQKSPEEDNKKPSKLAGAKRKLAEAIGEGQKRIAKKVKMTAPTAKVYKSKSPKKNSPVKVRKVRLIKKAFSRKTSTATVQGLVRRPSKLKKLVEVAKGKTVSRSKTAGNKRVVSTSSSTALIAKKSQTTSSGSLSRSSSFREKASSVKSRLVKTVRGAQSGRARSIRPVIDDVDNMDEM